MNDNRVDSTESRPPIQMTEDDAKQAIANAETYSGFTVEELRTQSETRDFASLDARLAWMTISGLEEDMKAPLR